MMTAMKAAPLSLLFAIIVPTLWAQDVESEKKEESGRRAWLVATHMPKDTENPLTVLVGDQFHKVALSKRRASDAIGIKGEQIVRVIRQLPKPEKPGEFTIEILAEASIPLKVRQALVILIPIKKEGQAARFHAMVQDLAGYRGGDYLFLNLTPTKVAIELAGQKLGAAPGETAIYDASSIKQSTNAEVRYHYFDQAKNGWQLISASTVVLRPTRRELCIFSWNEQYKRIDYHGITFPVEP